MNHVKVLYAILIFFLIPLITMGQDNDVKGKSELSELLISTQLSLEQGDTIGAFQYFDKAVLLFEYSNNYKEAVRWLSRMLKVNNSNPTLHKNELQKSTYIGHRAGMPVADNHDNQERANRYWTLFYNIASEHCLDNDYIHPWSVLRKNKKSYSLDRSSGKYDIKLLEKRMRKESCISIHDKFHFFIHFDFSLNHKFYDVFSDIPINKNTYEQEVSQLLELFEKRDSAKWEIHPGYLNYSYSLLSLRYAELYFATNKNKYKTKAEYYYYKVLDFNIEKPLWLSHTLFENIVELDLSEKYSKSLKDSLKNLEKTPALSSSYYDQFMVHNLFKSSGILSFYSSHEQSISLLKKSHEIVSKNLYEIEWDWHIRNTWHYSLIGSLDKSYRDMNSFYGRVFFREYDFAIPYRYYMARVDYEDFRKKYSQDFGYFVDGYFSSSIIKNSFQEAPFLSEIFPGDRYLSHIFSKRNLKRKDYHQLYNYDYSEDSFEHTGGLVATELPSSSLLSHSLNSKPEPQAKEEKKTVADVLSIDHSIYDPCELDCITKSLKLEGELMQEWEKLHTSKVQYKKPDTTPISKLCEKLIFNQLSCPLQQGQPFSVPIEGVMFGEYYWTQYNIGFLINRWMIASNNIVGSDDFSNERICNDEVNERITDIIYLLIEKEVQIGLGAFIELLRETILDQVQQKCPSDALVINALYDYYLFYKDKFGINDENGFLDDEVFIYNKAITLYNDGKFKESYDLLKPVADYVTEDSFFEGYKEITRLMSLLAYNVGNYDESLDYFSHIHLSYFKNDEYLNSIRGESYMGVDDFTGANEILRDYIHQKDPHQLYPYGGPNVGTESYFYYRYDGKLSKQEVESKFDEIIEKSVPIYKYEKMGVEYEYYPYGDKEGVKTKRCSVNEYKSALFYNSITKLYQGDRVSAMTLYNQAKSVVDNDSESSIVNYYKRAKDAKFINELYFRIFDKKPFSKQQQEWFLKNKKEGLVELRILLRKMQKYEQWDVYLTNYEQIVEIFKKLNDERGEYDAHVLWLIAMSHTRKVDGISYKNAIATLERMEKLTKDLEGKGLNNFTDELVLPIMGLFKKLEDRRKDTKQKKEEAERNEIAAKNAECEQRRLTEIADSLAFKLDQSLEETKALAKREAFWKNTTIVIIAIVSIVIISFITKLLVFVRREKDKLEKQLEQNELQKKELEAKITLINKQNANLERQKNQIDTQRKELTHRVINNLRSIRGIIKKRMENDLGDTTVNELKKIKEYIQTALRIQGFLQDKDDLDNINLDYLKELAELSASLGGAECISSIQGDIHLGYDHSYAIGVIVNEIITNSTKHAFGEMDDRKIFVNLCNNNDGTATLEVGDFGKGIPNLEETLEQGNGKSLGMTLIRQYGKNLDKKHGAVITNTGNGMMCRVIFETKKVA